MQKKALVLALGAALAASAAYAKDSWSGPDSVITMYGKVYPEIVRPSGSGATDAGASISTITNGHPTGQDAIVERTEVQGSNSRLGFRGYEKLGHDLRAIWQLETQFLPDSNDSTFAGRNSFVGLAGRHWGDIKLGRMDTPFKKYGDTISMFGISSGNFVSTSSVLRKVGFGTNSAMSFHLRRQNAVQYDSPTWGGFHGSIQYSTNEADTASRKPHVWSGGIAWSNKMFEVGLAHEIHWDLFGGSRNVPSSMSNFNDQSVHAKDKATSAFVRFNLGKVHRFEVDYIRKEYNEDPSVAGRFQSYRNNAWEALWQARWSKQWATQVDYVRSEKGSCSRVDAVCSTDGLDGTMVNLGVAYYFSKQTFLFLLASWLHNGDSSLYNNMDLQKPAIGEDITQYALGLSHSF